MIYLFGALLLVWLALQLLRAFARANPADLTRLVKRVSGAAALIMAVLLLFRGRLDMAIALGGLGAWLLAIGYRGSGGFFDRLRQRGRGVSRVRSAMIEMELHHESGRMRGTILAGPDEGGMLDQMSKPQCEGLYLLCVRDDPEGARLLEAYMNRRFAGWRAAAQDDGDARAARQPSRPGAMSQDEAYEVLGLPKGASRDEVVRSHRSLIKRLHPDQGGSTDLAARVNEAKEVLMRRHQ